jgi:hypothetical protein
MRPFSIARRQHAQHREGTKDALPDSYVSHTLIGLMGSDIPLEGGGWLEEFPHSRENSRWAVCRQWG